MPALAALDSQEIGVHRAIAWFAAAGLRRTRGAHQRRMDSEFYTFSSRRLCGDLPIATAYKHYLIYCGMVICDIMFRRGNGAGA